MAMYAPRGRIPFEDPLPGGERFLAQGYGETNPWDGRTGTTTFSS